MPIGFAPPRPAPQPAGRWPRPPPGGGAGNHADEAEPDHHRDDGYDQRVDQTFDSDASEPTDITDAGNPGDKRGEHQRHDGHQQQAQKKLADWVGHLRSGPDQRRRLASEGNSCTAAGRRANRQTDEDPNVQGATTSLHDIVGLVIEIGDDVLFEWLH